MAKKKQLSTSSEFAIAKRGECVTVVDCPSIHSYYYAKTDIHDFIIPTEKRTFYFLSRFEFLFKIKKNDLFYENIYFQF